MTDGTRSRNVALGLELLKKSTLEVLYDAYVSTDRGYLGLKQIREGLGIERTKVRFSYIPTFSSL